MALTLNNGWVVVPSGELNSGRAFTFNYSYGSPRRYGAANPPWLTWMTGMIWNRQGLAILYINNTDQELKLTSIKLKTVSCNSGNYTMVGYTNGYYYDTWIQATGDPSNLSCYVRVSNDSNIDPDSMNYGGSAGGGDLGINIANALNDVGLWQESDEFTIDIPQVDYNMDMRGNPNSGPTSVFGESTRWPEHARFIAREYQFDNSPIIQPKGICTVHLDVSFPTWDGSDSSRLPVVRTLLDPDEMEIMFEEERGPYIWRMTNGEWVLKRPLNILTGQRWSDIENLGGDGN